MPDFLKLVRANCKIREHFWASLANSQSCANYVPVIRRNQIASDAV